MIMRCKVEKKKQKLVTVALSSALILLGATTAFAAADVAEAAYGKMVNMTIYAEEEQYVEETVLEEYEISSEEAAALNISFQGAAELMADSSGNISTTITNAMWKSGQFQASSGQNIVVSCSASPTTVNLKMGIIEPDGTWRYVYSCGTITHTFALDQTGSYYVFIWNETTTSVKIIGYYMTNESE